MSDYGCYLFCSPDGPTTPFTGWLLIIDLIRVLVVAGGTVLIASTLLVLRHTITSGQWMRFLALSALCAAAIETEWEHLGDLPSVRLVLNVVGVGAALYGQYRFLRHELPARNTT